MSAPQPAEPGAEPVVVVKRTILIRETVRPEGIKIRLQLVVDGPITAELQQHLDQFAAEQAQAAREAQL